MYTQTQENSEENYCARGREEKQDLCKESKVMKTWNTQRIR